MAPATKITTCCYCGARAALVLRGNQRHELACGTCGAPLHDLKGLKVERAEQRPVGRQAYPAPGYAHGKPKKRKKKKKSMKSRLISELFDIAEDLFD